MSLLDVDSVRDCAAVTIDLDAGAHYHAIHGLDPPDDDMLVARGLTRFLILMRAQQLRGTVFVVAHDLKSLAVRYLVQQAHADGHEIASHSDAHRYDLSTQSRATIEADLTRASSAITALVGEPPVGFRAPGYNLSETLVAALDALGFRYDASMLPSPVYVAARAAAIAVLRVRARRSASLRGSLRATSHTVAFLPSLLDYRVAARSRVTARHIVEFPIGSVAGVPFLGTLLVAHDAVASTLTRAVLRTKRLAVLELHAIDFCAPDDVDAALLAVQPDARIALDDKLRRLTHVLSQLAQRRSVRTLADLARTLTR